MGFIDPSMWDDPRIVRCSDAAKVVWVYLLTGPESVGLPGLLRLGLGGLAEALRREDLAAVKGSLLELEKASLLQMSLEHRVIRVPNAPKYNAPRNPNFVRGWFRKWRQVPDCQLKMLHIASLRAVVDRMEGSTWRSAWADTFGAVDKSVRGISNQESLFASGTGVRQFQDVVAKSNGLANGSSDGSRDENGAREDASSVLGEDEVATEVARERDQVVKPFAVKRSPDPDLCLCPSPDPSPSPDPDPARPVPRVVQLPTGATLRERARRAWKRQEQLRAGIPGLRPLEGTERRLGHVMTCLTVERPSDDDVDHVLAVYAANAMRDPKAAKYFDGDSNWVPANFKRTVGKPAELGHTGGYYPTTSKEKYGEGGKDVPGLPSVKRML